MPVFLKNRGLDVGATVGKLADGKAVDHPSLGPLAPSHDHDLEAVTLNVDRRGQEAHALRHDLQFVTFGPASISSETSARPAAWLI